MWEWNDKIQELKKENLTFALATVTCVKGSAPREIGAKMIIVSKNNFFGTIGGGNLEKIVIEKALDTIKTGKGCQYSFPLSSKAEQCCGGSVDVFIEPINKRPNLYLYGGGHIGLAICKVLIGTPFNIHLIDDRQDWLENKNIPEEVIIHSGPWEKEISNFDYNNTNTYSVIMTYSHEMDEKILEALLKRPHHYLGLIGSYSKWERFKSRLIKKGILQTQLDNVKCPIGLDLGGKSPQEIAISFVSEILSLHYKKTTYQDLISDKYNNSYLNDFLKENIKTNNSIAPEIY